ncbi:hypothetical protein ACJMK2_031773 [Sinanodonta woodiana]|uniref:MULE transposase domain-containing protein n=1 Tax=Sinanodonta woodiana TaxID=1069815 RepID=A0ABD3X0B8_SINWO
MLNILQIAQSTHLTADEAMKTDVMNSINNYAMPMDNSSVNSHTWTASQNANETYTFNTDAFFKKLTLQLRLNHVRQPDLPIALTDSKMSRPKLAEADGYSYTVKMRCPATIIQRSDCYKRALHRHVHSTNPEIVAKVKVSSESTKQHKYKSAATTVDGVEQYQFPDKFIWKDIHVGIEVLARAKIWYFNATFKIIRNLFKQLLSVQCVHSFFKNGVHKTKQRPLVFAFMSGRRQKITRTLKQLIPSPPTVKSIVADIEAAVPIHGCTFHLERAIWLKLQELELRTTYIPEKRSLFLQEEHIAYPFARHKNQTKMIPLLYTGSWVQYARIFSVWEENQNGVISFSKSLKSCSSIYDN